MSYKVILQHLDSSAATVARTKLACHLANKQSAHLVGLAPAGLPASAGEPHPSAGKPASAQSAQQSNLEAQQASIRFEQQCEQASVRSFEARRVASASLDALRWHERFCDLIVIGRETPHSQTGVSALSFTEHVLLAASRPLLIVPSGDGFAKDTLKAVIAWDGSTSAAKAVLAALPLLESAESVEIAIVHKTGAEAMDEGVAGSEMLLYLARHGIKAHSNELEVADDIPSTLLSHVRDSGANLLVMGGYGHSRLRERLIGGTTRKVLTQMDIPVLMTH